MTGRELKVAVAAIPDDAKVKISGPDCGGYDWVWHDKVRVEWDAEEQAWTVQGDGEGDNGDTDTGN